MKITKNGRNGFRNGHRHVAGRRGVAHRDLRVLSDSELREIIDRNAQKYLGINIDQFLRRMKNNKPLKSPAWGPIEMMASLLRSPAE